MSQEGSSSDGAKRHERWWIVVFGLLIAAIIAGGALLAVKYIGKDGSLEIDLSSDTPSEVEVYLSGAVANEGIYLAPEDASIEDILQRAGGLTDGAEATWLKVYVPCAGESPFDLPEEQPEDTRVNINTASAEELDTLPGIGLVKAQAIIDYRIEKGLFRTVDELLNVNGIGPKTLEDIRDKVKVVD